MEKMKCPKGYHLQRVDDIIGCVPDKMRLNIFLEKFHVEPTELHYDVEMSWNDYVREHPRRKDVGKLWDEWFRKNKSWIKPIVAQVAKRDYKIEII